MPRRSRRQRNTQKPVQEAAATKSRLESNTRAEDRVVARFEHLIRLVKVPALAKSIVDYIGFEAELVWTLHVDEAIESIGVAGSLGFNDTCWISRHIRWHEARCFDLRSGKCTNARIRVVIAWTLTVFRQILKDGADDVIRLILRHDHADACKFLRPSEQIVGVIGPTTLLIGDDNSNYMYNVKTQSKEQLLSCCGWYSHYGRMMSAKEWLWCGGSPNRAIPSLMRIMSTKTNECLHVIPTMQGHITLPQCLVFRAFPVSEKAIIVMDGVSGFHCFLDLSGGHWSSFGEGRIVVFPRLSLFVLLLTYVPDMLHIRCGKSGNSLRTVALHEPARSLSVLDDEVGLVAVVSANGGRVTVWDVLQGCAIGTMHHWEQGDSKSWVDVQGCKSHLVTYSDKKMCGWA